MKSENDSLHYPSYSICSSCRKCCAVCPAQINIPLVLERYRQCQKSNQDALTYVDRDKSNGFPLDCIECGACSAYCPLKINVKEIIRKLAMEQFD